MLTLLGWKTSHRTWSKTIQEAFLTRWRLSVIDTSEFLPQPLLPTCQIRVRPWHYHSVPKALSLGLFISNFYQMTSIGPRPGKSRALWRKNTKCILTPSTQDNLFLHSHISRLDWRVWILFKKLLFIFLSGRTISTSTCHLIINLNVQDSLPWRHCTWL